MWRRRFYWESSCKKIEERGLSVRGIDLKYPEFSETKANDFMLGDLRDPYLCKYTTDMKFDEVY